MIATTPAAERTRLAPEAVLAEMDRINEQLAADVTHQRRSELHAQLAEVWRRLDLGDDYSAAGLLLRTTAADARERQLDLARMYRELA